MTPLNLIWMKMNQLELDDRMKKTYLMTDEGSMLMLLMTDVLMQKLLMTDVSMQKLLLTDGLMQKHLPD